MATLDADDLAAIAALFTAGTMEMALKRLAIVNDTSDPALIVSNDTGSAAQFVSTSPVGGVGISVSAEVSPGLLIYSNDSDACHMGGGSGGAGLSLSGGGGGNPGLYAGSADGPGIFLETSAGHGIAIASAGAGSHDVALTGSGDVLGSISIDLTQPLSDVCAATVGGALNGAHATAWGKVVKDVAAKLLKVFSFGSTSVPMATFGLDDGSNPTTRTPQ